MHADLLEDAPRRHRRLNVKVGKDTIKTFTYDGTMENLLSSALAYGLVPGQTFRPDIGGRFRSHHIVERDSEMVVEAVPGKRVLIGKLYSHFTTVKNSGASLDEAIKRVIDDPTNSILWGPLDTYQSKRAYLLSLSKPRNHPKPSREDALQDG